MRIASVEFHWSLCKFRRLIPYVVMTGSSSYIAIAGFGFNILLKKGEIK